MIKIYKQYKQQINYLIFGVLTTLINVAMYYACFNIMNISNIISNIIAWFLSVLFAYITNKIWVFESKTRNKNKILYELFTFFSARMVTGLIDIGFMLLTVDILMLDSLVMKVCSNLIVIVLNYIASKLIVFKG